MGIDTIESRDSRPRGDERKEERRERKRDAGEENKSDQIPRKGKEKGRRRETRRGELRRGEEKMRAHDREKQVGNERK